MLKCENNLSIYAFTHLNIHYLIIETNGRQKKKNHSLFRRILSTHADKKYFVLAQVLALAGLALAGAEY